MRDQTSRLVAELSGKLLGLGGEDGRIAAADHGANPLLATIILPRWALSRGDAKVCAGSNRQAPGTGSGRGLAPQVPSIGGRVVVECSAGG